MRLFGLITMTLVIGLANGCGQAPDIHARYTATAADFQANGCVSLGVDQKSGYAVYQCLGKPGVVGSGGTLIYFKDGVEVEWCYNSGAAPGPCY